MRTIYAVEGLAAGMHGTIVFVFALAPFYDVCFDGDATTRIVAHYKLVPDLSEPIHRLAHLRRCVTRNGFTKRLE